jgi:hypothetical protein
VVADVWQCNWERAIPFFDFPEEICNIIYTTNAVESLHMTLRKVTKDRGSFPTQEAAIKLLYLALQNVSKKWSTVQGWTKRCASLKAAGPSACRRHRRLKAPSESLRQPRIRKGAVMTPQVLATLPLLALPLQPLFSIARTPAKLVGLVGQCCQPRLPLHAYLPLNRAAFSPVPIGTASGATLRPCTSGKGDYRGPGQWRIDFSLAKNIALK